MESGIAADSVLDVRREGIRSQTGYRRRAGGRGGKPAVVVVGADDCIVKIMVCISHCCRTGIN